MKPERCECGGGWIDHLGVSVHNVGCPNAHIAYSPAEIKEREFAAEAKKLRDATALGLDMAIKMMRSGRLRLGPLPFEVGKHPYDGRFYLWRSLWCVWKEWRREHLH